MDFVADVKSEEYGMPFVFASVKSEPLEEDPLGLNNSGIKEECTDYTRHFIPDVKIEEIPTPNSFSLLSSADVKSSVNVIAVKEELNLEEPTDTEVQNESTSVVQNYGIAHRKQWYYCDDSPQKNETISVSLEDISASGFATCEASFEKLCVENIKSYTEDLYTDNSTSGNSSECLNIQPKSVSAKPFRCEACGKGMRTAENLERHRRVHTGENSFKCNVCQKSFVHSGRLTRHLRIHSEAIPIKCDVCGKIFSRSCDLKIHRQIHSGYKPFKCDICSKAFIRSIDLKEHERIHTGDKPFKCNVCTKAFPRSGDLNIHLRTHSGDKPFKCDVCSKAFIRSEHLKIHLRTHTGYKPFQCDVCGKAFFRSGHLKIHIRIHTGFKPFKCEICGNVFSQSAHLKVHLRSHTVEPSVDS